MYVYRCEHCSNASRIFKETAMEVYVKEWESQKLTVPPNVLEIHRLNVENESINLFFHPCGKNYAATSYAREREPCNLHSLSAVDPKVHAYMLSRRWARHDIHVFLNS